jgi:hypothetical protein
MGQVGVVCITKQQRRWRQRQQEQQDGVGADQG